MLNKILMPSGGQTTDEMVILKWNKSVGDFVKRGDVLFEIETDKAILEVESYAEGALLDIKYTEGQKVKTGEVVAYIGKPEDKLPEEENILDFQKSASVIQVKTSTEKEKPFIPEPEPIPVSITTPLPYSRNGDILQASPLAKSRAKAENIKLEDVARFFSKNLIKNKDITNYIAQRNNTQEENCYFIDVTSMRRTIAKRMRDSVLNAPHYTISIDIDMGEVISLRNKLNKSGKASMNKISYNDILMKVVAKAIETNPIVNSTYHDDKIKVYKDVNCGLAIALPAGLVVPVVRQVNKKTLAEIAVINAENIEKAKSNKLSMQNISGGTITISNLGMFGINDFTAIINQPEICILAIGSIFAKAVVIDRQIVIKDIMNITGSFDHRVIDGAIGAAFLGEIKTILENPHLLIL
jgi:pyruvate dehydrogenase E2 component (dihydrolipoamide acetyltransferase)